MELKHVCTVYAQTVMEFETSDGKVTQFEVLVMEITNCPKYFS